MTYTDLDMIDICANTPNINNKSYDQISNRQAKSTRYWMLFILYYQIYRFQIIHIINLNIGMRSIQTRILVVVLCLFWATYAENILLILDNAQLQKSHSKLITSLQANHHLEIAFTFGKTKIQLKTYDRFKYDHVIVFGLSGKESESQIKVNDIVSYFDDGGNVVVVGDIDTDRSFRKLYYAFGVELDQYGSKLKDYFSHHQKVDVLKTSNYVSAPFLHTSQPLLYQGVGLNMVNYDNYQLYELIASQSTTLSRNYIKEETTEIGRKTLAVAVQGLNNARAILFGSQYFFSDAAFEAVGFDNENAAKDLLAWAFRKSGVIRASNMFYHGVGGTEKQTLFNVGQKIYFVVHVETKKNEWVPFSTTDLQVQFVMLDPWVRVPLTQIGPSSSYFAQFYAPQKQGIYQFKVTYKKPGYTFLTYSQRVTLRPYKHDEYDRFLTVAYPYQFGLIATILSTFVFIIVYLYSGFNASLNAKED